MMNTDLPDRAPLPPRAPQPPSKRPTPCAGLFGWRKDAQSDTAKGKATADYPLV